MSREIAAAISILFFISHPAMFLIYRAGILFLRLEYFVFCEMCNTFSFCGFISRNKAAKLCFEKEHYALTVQTVPISSEPFGITKTG